MADQIRNGDVFLRKVDLPKDATRVSVDKPNILAYGEVTGHTHQILDVPVERYEHDGRAFILLERAGILTHEEHGEAQVDAGAYELIIERDYDPSEYARQVMD